MKRKTKLKRTSTSFDDAQASKDHLFGSVDSTATTSAFVGSIDTFGSCSSTLNTSVINNSSKYGQQHEYPLNEVEMMQLRPSSQKFYDVNQSEKHRLQKLYNSDSEVDSDSSSSDQLYEVARQSPSKRRSLSPTSHNDSILSELAADTTNFIQPTENPQATSLASTSSTDVIIESQPQNRPSSSSLAIRSNFGAVFKPPNKKGRDLSTNEIEALLKNQKHHSFNWITKKQHIHSFDTLFYQKKINDIPEKTTYDLCRQCNKVYSNTGNLARHQSACTRRPGTSLSSSLVGSGLKDTAVDVAVTKDFNENEKREIGRAFAECSVDGLLPFSLILHPSTINLIVSLVNIGASRKIDVPENPSLPSRYTIKNYSMSLAEERQARFRTKIPDMLKFSKGAFAADYGERLNDYLCVVLHCIREENNQLSMFEAIIGFEASYGKKPAEKVWSNIIKAVVPIGITEEMLKRMVGVSDEGSNFVKSLKDNLQGSIRCCAHVFNTCPKRTVMLYKNPLRNTKYSFNATEKEYVQIGGTVLSDVIQLSNIINKKKNVLEVLGRKLNVHCDTRFLSKLNCLRDIESNLETIYHSQFTTTPFIDDDEQVIFGRIYDRRRTLRVLIEIFSLYEHPVISLQASTKPTIHRVWPITVEIIRKLNEICDSGDAIGKALAKASLAAIERKMLKGFITDTHRIATVLNPSTRKLSGISAIEKQKVYQKIRSMLDEPCAQFNRRPLNPMEEEDEDADELKDYEFASFPNITDENFSLLDFWQKRKGQYTQLYQIAMNVLCIPATSCAPERGYSIMKKLITNERSQMDPSTVSNIMIGRSLKEFDNE